MHYCCLAELFFCFLANFIKPPTGGAMSSCGFTYRYMNSDDIHQP